MAMFLTSQHVGWFWDESVEYDTYDLVANGIKSLREVVQYVGRWFQGEEVDSTEIIEITQTFAIKVVVIAYTLFGLLVQYVCALVVYVFTNVDSLQGAIYYVRSPKENPLYKSITSLVVYEKPVYFDYNPFHWILKVAKIALSGTKVLTSLKEPCEPDFTLGKFFLLAFLAVVFYHSYYSKLKRKFKREKGIVDVVDSPKVYQGNIKWEAGLVKSNSRQEDHLNLRIAVNSNIYSKGARNRYNDSIASSTMSICKIVSDVLSNTPIEKREILNTDTSENSTPRFNGRLIEEVEEEEEEEEEEEDDDEDDDEDDEN